ncbi:hypothetical protein [Dishui Lake phycodnavirus 3]|nr:hypothetical protein [Dishui Lake phycodnavirus 3]
MKQSMDDLTNQAIDMVLKNNALQDRIVKPLRRKILPYVMCIIAINLVMFVMIMYLVRRLHVPPLPQP